MRKSVSDTNFMVKFNFFKDKNIPQYSVVRIIAISNMACLIEHIKTLERIWVMKYDIYPLNNYDLSGEWEYSQIYDNIAKEQGLK
jgi:hypothetical protein